MSRDKEVLVLLPGLLCDARLWQEPAAALHDIAVPLTIDLTQDTSIAAMASTALQAAPARFALAGLSMGGYVAFEILRRAPQRVTRLALFDTTAAPDTPGRAAERRASLDAVASGEFAGVTPRLLKQLIDASRIDSAVGTEVRAMAQRVGRAAFIRQQNAILTRVDSRATLAAIDVPTLIGVGASDVLTPPSEAAAMQSAIRGSTLVIFPECGHLPPLEVPRETTAALRDWLT